MRFFGLNGRRALLLAGLFFLVSTTVLVIARASASQSAASANSDLTVAAKPVREGLPLAAATPGDLQPSAGTLNGQLWFASGGNSADTSVGHVNSDASNPTLLLPTLPEAQSSIGLDLPAGYYFTVSTDKLFIEAHRISDNFKVDELQIGDAAGGPASQDIVNALAVDPIGEFIYVGKWGQDLAQSGIVRVSYTPATGLLNHAQQIGGTQTRLVNGTQAGNITDPRYIDLETDGVLGGANDFLYYSDNDNIYSTPPFSPKNGVYRIDLNNLGAGSTLLSSQAQFPTNNTLGTIGPVAVDTGHSLIYFETHTLSTNAATLYWMPLAGGTATAVTLPMGTILSIGDVPTAGLSFDQQTRQLYVTVQSNLMQGFNQDLIYQGQLSADGHSITSWVNTDQLSTLVGHTPDPNAHVAGTMFDLLPVFTKTDVGTHAIEQGVEVDIISSPSITDADNDHLASASIVVTNSFVGSGDDLFVLDGVTHRTSGTFTGTSIGVVRTTDGSGNQTLTLTGYDTFAHYQTVLDAARFASTGDNPTNYGGNTTRAIRWTASDGAPNIPFGAQNSGSTTLTIDAVNDAPVNHLPAGPSVNEDILTTLSGLSMTDVDADPANQTITVALSVTNGTLTVNTGVASGIVPAHITGNTTNSVSIIATQNKLNTTLANATGLRYQGTLNFNGSDLLHIVTNDNSHTPGPALTDTDDLGITVNSVNDAPAGADNTKTILEDNSYIFAAVDFGFSDAQDAAGPSGTNAFSKVKVTTVPAGTLLDNGAVVSAGGFVLVSHITAGQLVYTPTLNANGNGTGNFTFQVQDDGGTNFGGVDLDPTPNNFTINVTAVNDAPQGTNNTKTILEDGSYTFAAADFGFSDPTDGNAPSTSGANAFQDVIITTLPTAGILTLSGGAVTIGQTVTVVNIPNLLFTPVANGNGLGYSSLTFQVQDNGGTTNSGVDTDPSANTFTFNVTAVNDAPVLDAAQSPALTAIDEDNLTSAGDGIATIVVDGSVTDVDGSPVEAVAVTSVDNTNGKWQYSTNNGGAWTDFSGTTGAVVSFPTTARLLDGTLGGASTHKIRFVPNANFNGASSLTIRAWDKATGTAGNTADTTTNGGTTPYSTATDTAGIAVNAVNDAPSFIKGANQAVPIDFGARTVNGWATAISKGPADESAQTLIFNVTGNTNPGLFLVAPAIDPTTGTLTFTTQSGASGTTTITLTLSDDGSSTPPNVNTSAPQTFTIKVGPTAANSTISGHITDANGDSSGGVVVGLSNGRRTITRADGNYQFDEVPTGELYTLTPMLANHSFTPNTRSFSLVGNMTDAAFAGSADGSQTANPLDTDMYFVRQQYLDFLGREPDEPGLQFWANQIAGCLDDGVCIHNRRIDVSAQFFIAQEFQLSGSYIYDLYQGSLGRRPTFTEYSSDRPQVIGGSDLDTQKAKFTQHFVERPEFVSRYQGATTAETFVDALIQNIQQVSGVDLNSQRTGLIATYQSGLDQINSRALVVRAIADDAVFRQSQYNKAFVLMEYFDYLQRDIDQSGYNFWLDVLNQGSANNYRGMVCSFLTSAEYQRRFATVVTHSNADCGQ